MADSGYYYRLYQNKRKEVNSYENNLRDLNKVLNNLTNTMDDEIRAINKERDDLRSDLVKSVRHNLRFTACANDVITKKEKAVTADLHLSAAAEAIREEISRINGLKNTAISDRDYYYQKYKQAKEEEAKEFWDKLFSWGKKK